MRTRTYREERPLLCKPGNSGIRHLSRVGTNHAIDHPLREPEHPGGAPRHGPLERAVRHGDSFAIGLKKRPVLMEWMEASGGC